MTSYTEIKTFEDACKVVGIEPTLPDFSFAPESDREALVNHYKLVIIVRAINGDWKPDWNDEDQPKFYSWFYMKGSFSLCFVIIDFQCTRAGSRLCFFSSDAAEYAATQFHDLYNSYFIM